MRLFHATLDACLDSPVLRIRPNLDLANLGLGQIAVQEVDIA